MFSRLVASLADISPRCQACRQASNAAGFSLHGWPKRTPLAWAAAIPSAYRWWMNSRSVCAT